MKWLFASFCIFASAAQAHTFAPPNDLLVYESSDLEVEKLTRANFTRAISLVMTAYGKEVAASGRVLQINDLWTDPTVNAQAYQEGNYLMIDAFGGLARYARTSTNDYVGVLCHELGHHLGGRPKVGWASVEGQADYWGFGKCMLRIMSLQAASVAAQGLGNVLASLNGERLPSIKTPDRTKVSRTMQDHPGAQCRFDTFLAALHSLARPRCWYKP